jgi:hypothetical protein
MDTLRTWNVSEHGGSWVVRQVGLTSTWNFTTRDEAIEFARREAELDRPSRVLVESNGNAEAEFEFAPAEGKEVG